MTDAKPDPGWWQCEECNADIRPADAHTETEPGHDGPVTLAFCDDCYTG